MAISTRQEAAQMAEYTRQNEVTEETQLILTAE